MTDDLDALDRECAEFLGAKPDPEEPGIFTNFPGLRPEARTPFSPTRDWRDFGALLLFMVESKPDLQPTITYSREKLAFYAALRDTDSYSEDSDPRVALALAVRALRGAGR